MGKILNELIIKAAVAIYSVSVQRLTCASDTLFTVCWYRINAYSCTLFTEYQCRINVRIRVLYL